MPGKASAAKFYLADRQVHGERSAVFSLAGDFAADADDFRLAGPAIMADVGIVLGMKRLDQAIDIAADKFFSFVAEQSFSGRVDGFYVPCWSMVMMESAAVLTIVQCMRACS